MNAATGALIFWFIAIGLTTGFISFYMFGERGVNLIPSLVVGTVGSAIVGLLGLLLNIGGVLAFAVIGAVGFLFITNSFRQKEKPVFIEAEETDG